MLVVRGTPVTAATLEAGALALVVRAGAGYNTIDVAAASRRGIYVSNCPGKNAIAVAELTFALILALDRRMPDNVAELRAGTLEQEGVFEGARSVRPHARADRLRQHRRRRWRSARARLRHAGRRLEPAVRRGDATGYRRCRFAIADSRRSVSPRCRTSSASIWR